MVEVRQFRGHRAAAAGPGRGQLPAVPFDGDGIHFFGEVLGKSRKVIDQDEQDQ